MIRAILVERPDEASDLPLDIRGTEFQTGVWDALKTIPAGTTVSHAFLAARIGSPRAAPYVTQACGQSAGGGRCLPPGDAHTGQPVRIPLG